MASGSEKLGGLPEVDHDTIHQSIHVVEIDEEMSIPHHDLPPIETDLNDLPPLGPNESPNEFTDKRRYNKFEVEFEQKYFKRIRLSVDRQTVVRCHRDVDAVVAEMRKAIDASGLKDIIVGLDSEKELSTLQTSICIPDYPKRGKKFEKNGQ